MEKWLTTREPSLPSFPPHQLYSSFDLTVIRPYRDPVFLREMYVGKGLSPAQIAESSFSSKKTIMKYLIQYGIPLQQEDQQSLASGTFGTKTVNGRIVINETEARIIEKMRSLRNEGYSYRQITQIINTLGVPPKNGSKWHLKVVHKIINRHESCST